MKEIKKKRERERKNIEGIIISTTIITRKEEEIK